MSKNSASKIIDCHTHVGISTKNHLTGAYPYAMSAEDLLVRMDLLGIASSIVLPFDSSYYLAEELVAGEAGGMISSFPYEKENSGLLVEINEVFPEYRDRLLPFAMFDPSRETGRQAEHLRSLHMKYGLCGLKTVTTYNKSFVKDFQMEGNEVRDLAIEGKFPIVFHCSWLKTDIWANVFDVLEIAGKNPGMKICLAHSARFSKKALDMADSLPNCHVDTSAFKIHCDLAVADSAAIPPRKERFDSDYTKPAEVMKDLAEAYPDTILWGSDTPYHYFAQPWTDAGGDKKDVRLKARYDDEVNILKSLPDRIIAKIAYENTMGFLSDKIKG